MRMSDKIWWKRKVEFAKGTNMFGRARITREKIPELCNEIEGDNPEIRNSAREN